MMIIIINETPQKTSLVTKLTKKKPSSPSMATTRNSYYRQPSHRFLPTDRSYNITGDSEFEVNESDLYSTRSNSPDIRRKLFTSSCKSSPATVKTTTVASSLPMNVPDWSKILEKENHRHIRRRSIDNDEGGRDRFDSCDGGELLPPHEYLAKTRMASFSVHEGRDMSRVRNEILQKTEYYEDDDDGFHFNPTSKELINDYLKPKLRGEPCGDFIVMKDVYAKEPWLLDHTNNSFLKEDEWYYFAKRSQISKKNIGCGQYSKRKIIGDNNDGVDRGNWDANDTKNIIDEDTGIIIGIKQNLTYKNPSQNKKQKRGNGAADYVPSSESSWIMDEFRLPADEAEKNFQELVLCKIHKKKKSKKDKDHHHEDEFQELVLSKSHKKKNSKKEKAHHNEASTSTNHHQHESSSSPEQQQPDNIERESVLAASSEQQQPLLWGGSESEIPERNRDQSGEENMVHQTDALTTEKDEQVEAMEMTRQGEGDWIAEFMDKMEAVKESGQNLLHQYAALCSSAPQRS